MSKNITELICSLIESRPDWGDVLLAPVCTVREEYTHLGDISGYSYVHEYPTLAEALVQPAVPYWVPALLRHVVAPLSIDEVDMLLTAHLGYPPSSHEINTITRALWVIDDVEYVWIIGPDTPQWHAEIRRLRQDAIKRLNY